MTPSQNLGDAILQCSIVDVVVGHGQYLITFPVKVLSAKKSHLDACSLTYGLLWITTAIISKSVVRRRDDSSCLLDRSLTRALASIEAPRLQWRASRNWSISVLWVSNVPIQAADSGVEHLHSEYIRSLLAEG